jgi:hypothetical protein
MSAHRAGVRTAPRPRSHCRAGRVTIAFGKIGLRPEPAGENIAEDLRMVNLLLWLGRLAAVAGVLICGWAIYGRFSGSFYPGGFQVGTLLQGGMVGLLFACVCFLFVLTGPARR